MSGICMIAGLLHTYVIHCVIMHANAQLVTYCCLAIPAAVMATCGHATAFLLTIFVNKTRPMHTWFLVVMC